MHHKADKALEYNRMAALEGRQLSPERTREISDELALHLQEQYDKMVSEVSQTCAYSRLFRAVLIRRERLFGYWEDVFDNGVMHIAGHHYRDHRHWLAIGYDFDPVLKPSSQIPEVLAIRSPIGYAVAKMFGSRPALNIKTTDELPHGVFKA